MKQTDLMDLLTMLYEHRVSPAEAYDALRSHIVSAEATRRVRHKKRGTTYTVLGEAEVQISTASTARLLNEGDKLTIYRCEHDGKLWARFPDEFNGGRFEELPAPAPAPVSAEAMRETMAAWRVGRHYNIHVYEGERPVATFHSPDDARRCVEAVNTSAVSMREMAAKVAEACEIDPRGMLSGTRMEAVHNGACRDIAHAIRAIPLDAPAPDTSSGELLEKLHEAIDRLPGAEPRKPAPADNNLQAELEKHVEENRCPVCHGAYLGGVECSRWDCPAKTAPAGEVERGPCPDALPCERLTNMAQAHAIAARRADALQSELAALCAHLDEAEKGIGETITLLEHNQTDSALNKLRRARTAKARFGRRIPSPTRGAE